MNPGRPHILVADDKESILGLFRKILEDGFVVTTASDGREALAIALEGDIDVVVTDIRMPGLDGFELLREVKRERPDLEVILMTAFGSIDKAVEAMKQGAYDYLAKPFDPDEALLTVTRAVERKRLRDEARSLRLALASQARFENLIGRSEPMRRVFSLVGRAAQSDVTVLITGESGTGKELVARAIHQTSERKSGAFVAVNCGAIPETLIESELFGHLKGSFTGATSDRRGLFEEAQHGTLFLDEVGELPLLLQVKLNRALQERVVRPVGSSHERRVDVRVIAATNVDLRAATSAGRFREDLFYRLNIFPIRLPPLRERRDDIPLLAAHFLELHGQRSGAGGPVLATAPIEGFTPEALAALVRYGWPGNVRELENAIERAVTMRDGGRIPLDALPEEIMAEGATRASAAHSAGLARLSYRQAVELSRDRISREYLEALMREFNGNVTRAAEQAGMERESLHRLLRRYDVTTESFREGAT